MFFNSFILFECENILLAKDTGFHSNCSGQATQVERESSPNGLSSLKNLMAKHAMVDSQLDHVFTSRDHA